MPSRLLIGRYTGLRGLAFVLDADRLKAGGRDGHPGPGRVGQKGQAVREAYVTRLGRRVRADPERACDPQFEAYAPD